jgi:hypothetical protein
MPNELEQQNNRPPYKIPPLPAGFYVHKEISQKVTYEIPDNIKALLGESKLFAMELLDGILDKTFNMRLYEARVETCERPMVKAKFEKKVVTPSPSVKSVASAPKPRPKETMDGVSRRSRDSLHSETSRQQDAVVSEKGLETETALVLVDEKDDVDPYEMYTQESLLKKQYKE